MQAGESSSNCERYELHNGAPVLLHQACMKPTFTMKCPSDNDEVTRLPDFTTPGSVHCKVCNMKLVGDKDPRKDKLWVSVNFGALAKGDDNDYVEGSVRAYIMTFTDSQKRFLPGRITDGLKRRPSMGKIGPDSTCCDINKYTGTYYGAYPDGAANVMIIPYMMVGTNTTLMLPLGESKPLTDDTTGLAKLYGGSLSILTKSDDPAWEMLILKAIINATSEGTISVSNWQVAIESLNTTSRRRLHEDERRLTGSSSVGYKVMMSDTKSTKVTFDKERFVATLNKIATDSGLPSPGLSAGLVSATPLEAESITDDPPKAGAIYSSLAWTVFVLAVLAFFQ